MGIQRQEFHYALYPEGTFYKRHLDTFQNDKSRKLSVVCYLNSEDWKPEFGGELTIYTNENGTELNAILPKMSPLNPQYLTKKQRIFQKITAFIEKFKGVGGQI